MNEATWGQQLAEPDQSSRWRHLPVDERVLARAGLESPEGASGVAREFVARANTEQSRLRYAKDVASLARFLAERGRDLGSMTTDDMIAYRAELLNYAQASQRRMLSVARSLCRMLGSRQLADADSLTAALEAEVVSMESDDEVSTSLTQTPATIDQPAGYSEAQVQQLFSSIAALTDSEDIEQRMLAIRDQAMVALAVRSGLRASEIVALRRGNLEQVEGEYGPMWVVRASNRRGGEMFIPIDDLIVRLLERYVRAMETLGINIAHGDPLWIRIGRHAKPEGAFQMTTRNLSKLVAKRAAAAGIGGPAHAAQQLRRSTATTAAEAGHSVEEVAGIMRADVRTTRVRYLRRLGGRAKSVAAQPASD